MKAHRETLGHWLLQRMTAAFSVAHRETLGHWLLQRMTAAFLVPTILIANVSL